MASDTRTEKEKMLAGEMYNAFVPQLLDERMACRELIYDYNRTRATEGEKRAEIIHKLFGQFGANSVIEPPFICDYGGNVYWGENSFANFNLLILDTCTVHVGNYVLMGPDVKIYTATHPLDPQERLNGLEYGKPIRIGNNVWLGGGTIILPGVTIGDNSVIGAGSVVTKNIPDNVVAVGNPCKVIKQLQPPTSPPKQFQPLTGFDQEK
jgi:maltose O-acetyltransferase